MKRNRFRLERALLAVPKDAFDERVYGLVLPVLSEESSQAASDHSSPVTLALRFESFQVHSTSPFSRAIKGRIRSAQKVDYPHSHWAVALRGLY